MSELAARRCRPCDEVIDLVSPLAVADYLAQLPQWELVHDGQRIHRDWVVKDFQSAIEFFADVARVAENEGHHPDLHLVGFRNVAIELWTHDLGGLSENDFIMAAKIDGLPIKLRQPVAR